MKRFRTTRKIKNKKRIIFFLFLLLFTILFIIISLQKLKEEYSSLINYVLSDTVFNQNYDKRLRKTNLNNLIPTLSFHDKKELKSKPIIILTNNEENLTLILKDYLKKLGVKVWLNKNDVDDSTNSYYFDLQYSDKNDNIIINNKSYAKLFFLSNNTDLINKFSDYLNKEYLGLIEQIQYSEDKLNQGMVIQINKTIKDEDIVNSLEILSLMIYHTIYST